MWMRASFAFLTASGLLCLAAPRAHAADATPGFAEPIVHWGVQKGETCEDIARVMYGSVQHVPLLGRYNRIACIAGKPLPEGTTLILPAKVTTVPDASLKSSHPDVRGRPPGGGWAPIANGTPLYKNHNVQTLEDGRAHIDFIDHTHVFLAEHTLVIIYGTASNTRVSKVPPTVELQAGEVQAGLSALRGEPAEIAVPDGGRIRAASRDTVVERKQKRTTVAVFDGKAAVSSGGKVVDVPRHFGTRFEGALPPARPRPLPPAPSWSEGGTPPVVLAPAGMGLIATSWSAVPKAKAYRLEVARDADFHDLVVREEVPADVRSFRAEKMPPGGYRIRVRAIDEEEYLGIASPVRTVEILATETRGEGAAFQPGSIKANPYGTLTLAPTQAAEVALDDGPFGAAPGEIDLLKQAPKVLRIRTPNGVSGQVLVEYTKVGATVTASFDSDKRALAVSASFIGLEGIDVPGRVKPSLRVRLGERIETAPLAKAPGGAYVASIPVGDAMGDARLDVIDGRGSLLATTGARVPEKPLPPPSPKGPDAHPIGPTLPPWHPSEVTGVMWWSPTAPNAFGLGAGTAVTREGVLAQGSVRASGAIGPVGLDGQVVTQPLGDGGSDAAAWLGVRYRALRVGVSRLELGPALRLGLPMTAGGAATRLEAGGAVGGAMGKITLLANLGGRFRLAGDDEVPFVHPYLLAGATYEAQPWMRAYGLVDGHLLFDAGDVGIAGRGGLTLGAEAGTILFGALSARVGLGENGAIGPSFAAGLSIGVRDTGGGR
jgi:hypothetical protein